MARYEAFWVPGLGEEFDSDLALQVAFRWLRQQPLPSVVVMNAVKMRSNRPLLDRLVRSDELVSPVSGRHGKRGPLAVLAVWPAADTLEFAEMQASGGKLCVVPSHNSCTPWIHRSVAQCLVAGWSAPEMSQLPEEVQKAVRSMLFLGGHNRFLGGYEKEDCVRRLRQMKAEGIRLDSQAIEEFALASGETDSDGARRLRGFVESVNAGKALRGAGGRVI